MDLIEDQSNFTFLLCSERSGSNFITKLMNNHSKICGPSTKHIINPVSRNYFRYKPLENNSWDQLLKDVLNLFSASFSVWKSEFTFKELKTNIKEGDVKGLIEYFFIKEMEINNKKHLFIKEIKLFEFYPFIKHYFPNSNFVYQVRDPRDMALSWKKNKTHKGGIVSAAKQWKNDQQQYLKIYALEELNNNVSLIKYEDLVGNSKIELLKLFKILNLSYEETMLEMGKDDLTNKNATQQKAWENLSKPIMSDNYNKYRKELSPREISIIEKICFFEMKHLNYKPENNWNEITSISNNEIERYHQSEIQNLEYNPENGVIENMEAKKKFYERLS